MVTGGPPYVFHNYVYTYLAYFLICHFVSNNLYK